MNSIVEGIYLNDNCIEFSTGGAGRDYYCGIMWTPNGDPIGFGGASMNLVPSGIGWKYEEKDGDNRYYIERIIDNWFVYEMVF